MKKFFYIFVSVFILSAAGDAIGADVSVPMYLNFHSQLTDGGGNLVSDGQMWATFRIVDEAGAVLYEERQQLQVTGGNVSAFVGGGVDADNAFTGGIPAEALYPHGAKYLEVIPDDAPSLEKMEIVSSPYSIYSQTALGVVARGVTGDMIAEGSIKKEHLDAELVSAIFPQGVPREMLPNDTLFQNDLTEFKNSVQSGLGAATIGVEPKFVFSGSATVQGVLADLDLAIRKRQEEISIAKSDVVAQISTETGKLKDSDQALANADAALNTAISGKVSKTGDEMSGNYLIKNGSLLFKNKANVQTIDFDGTSGAVSVGDLTAASVTAEAVTADKINSNNLPAAVAWAVIKVDPDETNDCKILSARNIINNVECTRSALNDRWYVKLYFDKSKLPDIAAPYAVQLVHVDDAAGDILYVKDYASMTNNSFTVVTRNVYSTFAAVVIK